MGDEGGEQWLCGWEVERGGGETGREEEGNHGFGKQATVPFRSVLTHVAVGISRILTAQ